ncbi:MAG: aminoglycoside phosphotransferase family protein [Pseudomonadota bacterium]
MPAVPAPGDPPPRDELIAAYGFSSAAEALIPFGPGRIHRSYRLVDGAHAWLLQQLNTRVFPHVSALAANVAAVTAHLAAGPQGTLASGRPRPQLTLRPTRAGAPLYETADGHWWRAYRFIDGAAPGIPTDLEQVRQAAACFGEFLRACADLPADSLALTIPHFHDTAYRYRVFADAVTGDVMGRARDCAELIAFAQARAPLADRLEDLARANGVPQRVVHNDCKLDNVLFDASNGEALCVVDLDTVMPGLAWHDIGDLIRSAAATGGEDGDALALDPQRFEAVVSGYLAGVGDLLSSAEQLHLTDAAQVITYELGLRFLTDHLAGDTYFRVQASGDNLRRAQRQFGLLTSMERQASALLRVVERAAAGSAVAR